MSLHPHVNSFFIIVKIVINMEIVINMVIVMVIHVKVINEHIDHANPDLDDNIGQQENHDSYPCQGDDFDGHHD